MKEWMRRFGVMSVLGALLCGVVVAGCGGDAEEDDTVAPAGNTAEKAPDAGDE